MLAETPSAGFIDGLIARFSMINHFLQINIEHRSSDAKVVPENYLA